MPSVTAVRAQGEVGLWTPHEVTADGFLTGVRTCTVSAGQDSWCSVGIEPFLDPCQGETYVGRCDGNTVVWCENERIYTWNCSDAGRVCAYDPYWQYYSCRR